MTTSDVDRPGSDTTPPPGRPVVLESMAPGTWTIILGSCLAVLAPLFGFLIGTTFGPGEPGAALNPLQLGLFIGVVVGGLGVVIAGLGAWRLVRRRAGAAAGERSG